MPTCIRELIDAALVDQGDGDRRTEAFHYSRIGLCPRATILERTGAEKRPLTAAERRRFERGHVGHAWLQDLLTRQGALIGREYPVGRAEDGFTGKLDAIVTCNGHLELNEFKFSNTNALKYLEEPKPQHLLQVLAYFFALKAEGDWADVDRVRLVYLSEDFRWIREFLHVPTERDAEQVTAWKVSLLGAWRRCQQDGTLPAELTAASKDIWECFDPRGKRNWICPFLAQCPQRLAAYQALHQTDVVEVAQE